ncbi:thiamine biosynthesis protein ThiF (plasmid) [Pseudohalocynthiibacter aestuariivivens]|nr:thiamine biosynthesis protein ThiF [Pseudohalocynthiibacter aestuariivivens]QIE48201.1 thiamine biosynthesis protein ThiF [Pseudohalocynthiibacter aestuariivivens]
MDKPINGDTLHRLMKQALDSGTVETVEAAERLFEGYRLSVAIDPADADNPEHQTALLTVVALASRVFLGGVHVSGVSAARLLIGQVGSKSLADEVIQHGGAITPDLGEDPVIFIGGGARPRRDGFAIRTQAAGWRGGIMPAHSELGVPQKAPIATAATLSAALAVAEAYFHVSKALPIAGRRTLGLSLWKLNPDIDWRAEDPSEPTLKYLPNRLWLIGLGHLGQAYLWNVGLLPYADPSALSLVLQDIDDVTTSTHSTSILTAPSMVGQKKTRVLADWAEDRGHSVSLMERYFADDFMRQPTEPAIALCGLDNALGRRALDKAGFDLVVEAGLGRGHHDFQKIRMHVLPGLRPADDIWLAADYSTGHAMPVAYEKLVKARTLDQCGATLLAGKAVGAPFVGMVASCLAVSEILRLLHGGRRCQLADLDLLSIDHRHIVESGQNGEPAHMNPGFTDALIG